MDLPVGSIILWYKQTTEIPNGWHLCDGNEGTPDLRGKFVIGADTDDDRTNLGSATHTHTNSNAQGADNHGHHVSITIGGTVSANEVFYVGPPNYSAAAASHWHSVSLDIPNSGTHEHAIDSTLQADNNPPHIQIYYIMRIL